MNMLQNAKDLIAKGKELGDPDLIKMGMELLKNTPTNNSKHIYICDNCGHEVESDKVKKRCPNCKKHKLQLVEPESPQEQNDNPFFTQIRKEKRGGVIKFQNNWTDDMSECFDEEDAKLKKITKPSMRNRKEVKLRDVTCSSCGKTEKVHPIHAPTGETRSVYMCPKCIRNRKSH